MAYTVDTDIVESLRYVAKSAKPMDAGQMREAANEIERLRQSDRSQPVRTSACQDSSQKNSPLTAEDTPTTHAAPAEGSVQDRCTLTVEEREAIVSSICDYAHNDDDEDCARMVATLRNLLERLT